jgi:glutamate/tyrosine decarboxylase-like PLP-dependent enzyme
MPFQVFAALLSFIFTSRALPFVVGMAVGGMLAVSSERYADWMFGLVGVWSMVVTAVTGK